MTDRNRVYTKVKKMLKQVMISGIVMSRNAQLSAMSAEIPTDTKESVSPCLKVFYELFWRKSQPHNLNYDKSHIVYRNKSAILAFIYRSFLGIHSRTYRIMPSSKE
jgi:hypothetical protein